MLKHAYYAAGAALAGVEKHVGIGRDIFDHADDWDICIVLDSARLDLFRECAQSSGIITDVGSAWSVGSVTTEWLANTFSQTHSAEIGATSFVTATPHSQTVFRDRSWLTSSDVAPVPYPESPAVYPEDFGSLHEVWRSHATVENVVPPWTMRDATIEAWQDLDRVVAHWMQPHEPFIAENARLSGGDATKKNVWSSLQSGELDPVDVWQSYRATLMMALPHLEVVLSSVDARVLLTADHGNAFGEWGIYGHPFGFPQPAVRKVPWCIVDAEKHTEHVAPPVLDTEHTQGAREEQLRALGYL